MDRIFDSKGVDDLVLLSTIGEDEILKTLEYRFKKDQIYTYIGPVLLSVNPFRFINGMYNMQTIKKYCGRYMYELQPHVYAVAEDTYRSMLSKGRDQYVEWRETVRREQGDSRGREIVKTQKRREEWVAEKEEGEEEAEGGREGVRNDCRSYVVGSCWS